MKEASAGAAAVLAFVMATGLTLATALPASALPVLETADAEELVTLLAEASEEQDVCYGWRVEVDDDSAGTRAVDRGSNLGLDRGPESCARFVQLVGRIQYTSESSESEDSASWDVVTNIATGPGTDDLRRAGYSADALVGARDDVALYNATAALPLLTAEAGAAPPVPAEPDAQPVAPGDMATGRKGSDWLRQNGGVLAMGGLVVAAGLGWAGYGVGKGWVESGRKKAGGGRAERETQGETEVHDEQDQEGGEDR